jgi:hypothetical protein
MQIPDLPGDGGGLFRRQDPHLEHGFRLLLDDIVRRAVLEEADAVGERRGEIEAEFALVPGCRGRRARGSAALQALSSLAGANDG